MTRVLIVDDQPLVRSAVRGLLSGSGIEVVGEAADGVEATTAMWGAVSMILHLS